jgi:Holliday junction resolvase RusA-like endonuclease
MEVIFTEEFKFVIPGEPFGKQRPRASRRGNFIHMYTPEETVAYEEFVRECFNKEHKDKSLVGELKIHVVAYFTIAQSLSKIKKQHMLAGLIRPVKKPDWDNLGKIVSDALNEVAYHDDSAIVDAHVEKFYSDEPRVEVSIIGEIGEISEE